MRWNLTSWTFPAAFSQIMFCSVFCCTEAVVSVLMLHQIHREAPDALWHVKQSEGDRTLSHSWMTASGFKSLLLIHKLLKNSLKLCSVLQFYSLANECFSNSRMWVIHWYLVFFFSQVNFMAKLHNIISQTHTSVISVPFKLQE